MQLQSKLSDSEEGVPFKNMVSYRLSRAQAKLNAQAHRILKKNGGLSLTQWRLLVILDVHETATHSAIARLTEFDKGLLSRTIKRMIELGLITTKRSESDSRQHQLTMSDLGRAKFKQARPMMRARQAALLSSIDEAELEALFSALSKLEAVVDKEEEQE